LSVKTKLSAMISVILLTLLVLNVILNEYALRVNLRSELKNSIARVGNQVSQSLTHDGQDDQRFKQSMENRLYAASVAAASKLDMQWNNITNEELAMLAKRLGVHNIALLEQVGGQYYVRRSSSPQEPGVPASPQQEELLMEILVDGSGSVGSGDTEDFRSEVLQVDKVGDQTIVRSFYKDQKRGYLISCTVKHTRDTQSAHSGDHKNKFDSVVAVLKAQYPELLEITAFRPTGAAEGPEVELPDAAKIISTRLTLFGDYDYKEDSDIADINAAMTGESVFSERKLADRSVLRGVMRFELDEPVILAVAMDKRPMLDTVRQQRNMQLVTAGALFLIVMACSRWLGNRFIRPVRLMLGKVDELGPKHDDRAIPLKRKDELEQLAQRLNYMSKNLGIYMTKLQLAFEENRAMRDYLESFINHTMDAIHVVDLEGRTTQVNRAFEKLFGYSVEESLGNCLLLTPEHLKQEEEEAIAGLRAGKLLSSRETQRVTKNGEWLDVSVTISPIRDKNGEIRAIASITRDMTSRNKMEELLRHSEKLTTVGQLAAGVAHEIRNPLTTLRGFLQLQQQTHKLNPQHIDIMLSELDRINLIVGEFLILAKPQATRFQKRDVRFILGDVISLLDSQAHLCNVMFDTQFTSQSCLISCEENQLKQVFINILKNAIEAMPSGGQITIAIEHQDNNHLNVTITDQGIGIPEDMIPRLGDPFFTGKETGTGLGLMVSGRIIQSHQGAMHINSRVNEGTSVVITLPLTQEAGTDTAEEVPGA